MRVLITGSTAQQASSESHRRSANFTGLIRDELRADERNEVHWREPSVTWDDDFLGGFDHVIVGVAPPQAMGANRIYGALSVVERMWGDKRLTLVADSPDPNLITRGLRTTLGNWESFTKPFFAYRKEYELATEPRHNARLMMSAIRLSTRKWPRTVVPGTPWTNAETVEAALPPGARGMVRTANLDHQLLTRFKDPSAGHDWRIREWAYEKSPDRKWLVGLALGLPVRELKPNHRVETDTAHAQQLRESVGLLIAPHRGQAWWTPKIAMALAQLTPVFTDWRQSRLVGAEWAGLPGTHEVRTPDEARDFASEQYVSYAASIPGPSESKAALYKAAGMVPSRSRRVAS